MENERQERASEEHLRHHLVARNKELEQKFADKSKRKGSLVAEAAEIESLIRAKSDQQFAYEGLIRQLEKNNNHLKEKLSDTVTQLRHMKKLAAERSLRIEELESKSHHHSKSPRSPKSPKSPNSSRQHRSGSKSSRDKASLRVSSQSHRDSLKSSRKKPSALERFGPPP